MAQALNYHHLHYFWVVARAGSMSGAAHQLDVSVQTVSAQVRALERSLGHALLRPAGRGLALTDAGAAALRQADRIFELGAGLPSIVQSASAAPSVRLNVGVLDVLSKWTVHRLLRPVLDAPGLHLHCQVDEFEDLLGDLALHRFDVVLADRPPPAHASLRLYSRLLCDSPLAWFGVPRLAARARRRYPRSLAQVPMVLPTSHAAARARLDHWLAQREVQPRLAGECEDSGLLEAFGAAGMGIFPAMELAREELEERCRVRWIGTIEGLSGQCHAIGRERRIVHPLVARLAAAAQLPSPSSSR